MKFFKENGNEKVMDLLQEINQKMDVFLKYKMIESEEKLQELDCLTDVAIEIVKERRNASVRLLARELRIGTHKAIVIMGRLEEMGVVSKPDHRNHREILI